MSKARKVVTLEGQPWREYSVECLTGPDRGGKRNVVARSTGEAVTLAAFQRDTPDARYGCLVTVSGGAIRDMATR